MQLIQNGSDAPERLLQAHEEGRVVFFCGAGISYPAGLPGFKGLVTRVRDALGLAFSPPAAAAFKRGQNCSTSATMRAVQVCILTVHLCSDRLYGQSASTCAQRIRAVGL
jgi:hypothetical protein